MFLDKNIDKFKSDILLGLSDTTQKFIPSKYLYDNLGSELFELITVQPEYYPTRTEIKILENYSEEIVKNIKKNIILIELGSGSSKKTHYLFEKILLKQNKLYYFPIDISFKYLNTIVSNIENSFKQIIVKGIPDDYIHGINRCNNVLFENNIELNKTCRLIVFFGSSIGNFEIDQARDFLKSVRGLMSNNDLLLIGFDLVKDQTIIKAAYNDKAGITSKFNLNLLNRINRELDGNFDLQKFSHEAFFNSAKKRVEMHIKSEIDQYVFISLLNERFHFRKDESIHTESSYKYTLEDIQKLTSRSGFKIEKYFSDDKNWFELVLLKPD